MVTGDYSRGASGFWIENGERTYAVSEVTIAGHLLDIFRTLTPANDLEFRYGTNAPTRAAGGPDRCRAVSRQLRDAARSASCARPANSRAQPRAGRSSAGPRATTFAGERGRHRGQRFPARAAAGDSAPDAGWLSEETEDDRARAPRRASGSSIRSTAPAPISPAAPTGPSRSRWSRTAGRSRRALCAGDRRDVSRGCGGQGATLNGAPIAASAGDGLAGAAARRPEALPRTARQHRARASCRSRRSIRWRCGSRGSRRATSTPPLRRPGSHDWDLAAADLLVHEAGGVMTDFAGKPLSYNRAACRAWRAGRRRARPPRRVARSGARPHAEFA